MSRLDCIGRISDAAVACFDSTTERDPECMEAIRRQLAEAAPLLVDEGVTERVMMDLLPGQVEILQRFNRPLRDEYMHSLHTMVRESLVAALSGQEKP